MLAGIFGSLTAVLAVYAVLRLISPEKNAAVSMLVGLGMTVAIVSMLMRLDVDLSGLQAQLYEDIGRSCEHELREQMLALAQGELEKKVRSAARTIYGSEPVSVEIELGESGGQISAKRIRVVTQNGDEKNEEELRRYLQANYMPGTIETAVSGADK